MNNNTMHLESVIVWVAYLILMVLIGSWTSKKIKTTEDYTVGGRKIGAILVALSHGAGAMSGFMFMGLPGYAYMLGLFAFWYEAGDAGGGYINFTILGRRLNALSHHLKALTPIDLIYKRFYDPSSKTSKYIPLTGGIIGLIFTWLYLLAQIIAAGKVTQVLLGIPYYYGVIVGGLVVLMYVMAGGLEACMYTDAVQAIIMFFSAIIAIVVGFKLVGGFYQLTDKLMQIDPTFFSIWGKNLQFEGQYGEIIGALLIYMIGYMGLPHINAFSMSAKNTRVIENAALINPIWSSILAYSCVFIGLFGILLLPDISDPELVAPTFFYTFTNPWIAGLMMSSVYCAIMSTADILTLTSATLLVNDIYIHYFKPNTTEKKRLFLNRIATFILGFVALAVALIPDLSVFAVVISAFGVLASSFLFVNLASVYWKGATPTGAISSMIGGAVINTCWELVGFRDITHIHPFFAGIITSGLLLFSVSLFTKKLPKEKQELVNICRRLTNKSEQTSLHY